MLDSLVRVSRRVVWNHLYFQRLLPHKLGGIYMSPDKSSRAANFCAEETKDSRIQWEALPSLPSFLKEACKSAPVNRKSSGK